jgi:dienelactone hydrolase
MRAILIILFAAAAMAQTPGGWEGVLGKRILDPKQPMVEVQIYAAGKVPVLPTFGTAQEWRTYSAELRKRILDDVVFRGEAKKWRETLLRAEWQETIRGGSDYEIRKVRIEAVPGLWIAGLLYRPLRLAGKVPAVLNLNGHEEGGNSIPYIQERCIHLARSGVMALNLEWFGRGQMTGEGYDHYRMPQLDLTGTSGLAVHYLAMRKGLDLLESLAETDRTRMAVTGLSGGGWQTIVLSALDERVALANPVAGYASYVTRTQFEKDLGDAEQTPSDLASVADYTHLTALLSPRWARIANNAFDDCCFVADHALGPIVQAATPIYRLLDVPERFGYHVNYGKGHNYDQENRESFYRVLRDAFFAGKDFAVTEKPLEAPVRKAKELEVALPADNLDFHSLALRLAQGLPRTPKIPAADLRKLLRSVTRAPELPVDARITATSTEGDVTVRYWKLQMGGAWTVPAVELAPANARSTAILVADEGRGRWSSQVDRLLRSGTRGVAVDPFYCGESKIASHDLLYGLLIACLGDRPLGLQAGQLMAAARWLKQEHPGEAVELAALGPRTGLAALVAGALEPQAIDRLNLERSFASLKEILQKSMTVQSAPELFCFGLLEQFDIPEIAALVSPRPVDFKRP